MGPGPLADPDAVNVATAVPVPNGVLVLSGYEVKVLVPIPPPVTFILAGVAPTVKPTSVHETVIGCSATGGQAGEEKIEAAVEWQGDGSTSRR